ncbi:MULTISPECIES: sigma-70 family RNA polymerase sigma factor [unclassified Streptomyces]|uniref:sigma-70 family RNA polymerase sigma factor n=1 Tax=unclassified Streptomyces TaxID=2593676 RepID=UPI0006AEF61F|nr:MULTISPECIES: sigma-70 family RNA polymerase sigma factor [unclassified Streptomyces]
MGEEARVERDAAGLRNALRELYAELGRAAVGGVVSEQDFRHRVGSLGLARAEQDRLRSELARLGLQVRRKAEHTDHDEQDARKVVHPAMTRRVLTAHTLLSRYADARGRVNATVVEGVARLSGLTPAETRSLREAARTQEATEPSTSRVVPEEAVRAEAKERPPSAETEFAEWEEFDPDQGPDSGSPTRPLGDVGRAVRAAQEVLNEDRFTRRPEKRMLTAEEEVGLAVLVRGGAERIESRPTEAEIAALPASDLRVRARNCFVVHNQGLAHNIALRHGGQGLDHEDLFQHGAIGLLKAALKFDPTKGYKFSTYATWWIRQSISRAVADEGAVIRIPVHFHEQVRKVAAAERRLQSEGRPWSAAHVAVACDLTVQRVEEIRKVSRRTDSLDRVIGEGVHLGDLVALERPLPSAEHLALEAIRHDHLLSLLTRFDARDARILLRRTGLDGGDKSTLEDLGKEFGVTRERIRQLEVKALAVLREMLLADGIGPGHAEPPDPKPPTRNVPPKRARRPRTPTAVPAQRAPLGPPPDLESAVPSGAQHEAPEAADMPVQLSSFEASAVRPSEAGPARTADTEPSGGLSRERAAEPQPRQAPDAGRLPSASRRDPEPEARSAGMHPADWEQALAIPVTFAGSVAWLAEYALLALGDAELAALLGQSAAADVVRAAKRRGTLDRSAVTALEVLQKVFGVVKSAGGCPADFLDCSFEALNGLSPRAYLTERPLVRRESRLAVRDALREFASRPPGGGETTAVSRPTDAAGPPVVQGAPAPLRAGAEEVPAAVVPVPAASAVAGVQTTERVPAVEAVAAAAPVEPVENVGAVASTGPRAEACTADRPRAEAVRESYERRIAALRAEAAESERRLREEHADALAHERERAADAAADTERQLDELESALLKRVDRSLQRQAASLRRAADERMARLRERAEAELQTAQQSAGSAARALRDLAAARQRADEAEHLLRRSAQEHEARISALAERLWSAESALAQRERALEDADTHAAARVEAVERWAAQRVAEAESMANARVAQAEHDAWVHIGQLQEEQAAMTASERRPLRDWWRRG